MMMDEKQLRIEFLSILTESHPGLTFEEFRDSCVFLLYYKYSCILYADRVEESYQLRELVRMAIRGKLQIPSFLRFMESASSFFVLAGSPLPLTALSFYRMLTRSMSQEKGKSCARFIRKLIKKIDAWDSDRLLLEGYPDLFYELIKGFAQARKETRMSEPLLGLYRIFFEGAASEEPDIFIPNFRYGLLYESASAGDRPGTCMGYESEPEYIEIFRILNLMRNTGENRIRVMTREEWRKEGSRKQIADRIAIYMPDGIPSGEFVMDEADEFMTGDLTDLGSKGELPFILSALPLLREEGCMAAVLPSSILFREGREAQIRRYLTKEINCLDTVVLLPDQIFSAAGQQEVMLFFRKNRKNRDLLLIDGTDMVFREEDDPVPVRSLIRSREDKPGISACASPEDLENNDYNLNLPRYITKTLPDLTMDTASKRERIAEIDLALKKINENIALYRSALEMGE